MTALLLVAVTFVGVLLAWTLVLLRRSRIKCELLQRTLRATDGQLLLSQQSSQHRVAALDRMPMGLVIAEAGGKIAFSNRFAQNLKADRRMGSLLWVQVGEVLELSAERESVDREFSLLGPPPLHLVLHGREIPNGVVVVIEDVSDRVRLDAMRKDFVANLSHELKSPLGAMALLAETLVGEEDEEVRGRLLQRINNEALRMGRLVDDLLDLSRIESGHTLNYSDVKVGALLNGAIDQIEVGVGDRELLVDVHDNVKAASAYIDLQQMTRALVNLVENAVKYSDEGSRVVLAGKSSDLHFDIQVSDSGVGMPADELDRIFERFYRVDNSRSRKTGGTGLGLSIVRHITESHGGEVFVTSAEGVGSTFTLRFPRRMLSWETA